MTLSFRLSFNRIKESRYFFVGISLILLFFVSGMLSRSFFTIDNMIIILRQTSILLMLSLGLTAVVLTGNIDLSVGSFSALCGCICAQMMVHHYSTALSVAASLLVGGAIGLINGLLVGWLKLPSFVATYGMNMVASGLATIVMNGGVIYALPPSFTRIGVGYVGMIPVPVILSAIMCLVLYWLLQKTTFGRNIYLIGLNPRAAEYSAISGLRTLLAAYLICGFTGAFGGVMMTARLNAADAGMTEAYGLKIVAAVVVGGTSLLGGEGGVTGTILGALTLTVIVNIMNIMGVRSEWQNLVVGAIILLMAGLDVLMRIRRKGLVGILQG